MGASNKAGGRLTTDAGWQLPFASFVNPTYIGPGDRNTGVVPSTGFALGSSAGLVIQFSGTYAGITLFHEQTLDPDGATGWFPVAGQVISGAPGTPGAGLAASGSAYCFPSFGALHRIRVTGMASGTVIVFAGLIYDVYDVSTAGGGGGGGGDVNITEVGGNPVTTTIPVSGTVTVTGVATAANQTAVTGSKAAGTAATSSILTGGVFNTALPTLTNGQQAALQFSSDGRLYTLTTAQATFGAVQAERTVIYDSTGAALDYTTPALVAGGTAADAALTAAPVTVGGRAANATPAAMSANGDVVNAQYDLYGRQITRESLRENKGRQVTTITSSTTETTIVTATASVFHDIFRLLLTNTSATATAVTIRDTTGGSVVASFVAGAGETVGFSGPISSGMTQAAVNTNWTAQCGTSVASLIVTAEYVNNP